MYKLWDDVVAGPQPERGQAASMFKNITVDTKAEAVGSPSTKAVATPLTPKTPTTPSPKSGAANVWRSVFHPGSNLNSRSVGAHYFDNPAQSSSPSPTTYDWLYSDETRSKSFR